MVKTLEAGHCGLRIPCCLGRGLLLGVFLFCVTLAMAQGTEGTISGTAKDDSGAVMPGAKVTITHLETGTTRTLVTDYQGRYRAPQLALGSYEVKAELTGFRTTIRRGIELTVGQQAVVDLTLQIGEVVQEVVVTAAAPLINLTTSEIGGLVDDKKIRDLPLNGRSFEQLATLQPAVVTAPFSPKRAFNGVGNKISVGGARPSQGLFLLDGTDVNDTQNNTPGGAAGTFLGVDAVREFSVLTSNYSAEYGRSPGGIVNVVTRSGTNQFHGTAFEFHRNDNLDARNFFDKDRAPEFKRNNFGGTLGGPILKNKTFFFGAYEGLRERLGVTQVARVPNATARQGFIPSSPGGPLVNVGVNPVVKPYLDLYPLPNGRDFGNGIGEFQSSEGRPIREDFAQMRVDHQLSDMDSFFARYTIDDSELTEPVNDFSFYTTGIVRRNQYLTLQETHTFSPQLLNTFRFGFNRSPQIADDSLVSGDINALNALSIVPGKPFGKNGRVEVGGLSVLGGDSSTPRLFFWNSFQWSDDVNWTAGSHSFKYGALFERFRFNNLSDNEAGGRFVFSNLTDFLRVAPTEFRASLPTIPSIGLVNDSIRGIRQTLFGFYGQDDWRLRPNLTLNLGLRYEFVSIPTEVNGKAANLLDPDAVHVGRKFFLDSVSDHNFAPRVGLAWDPFGNGKTSVRAGYGIFWEQILPGTLANIGDANPPFKNRASVNNPQFPNAVADILAGRFSIPTPEVQGLAPTTSPSVQQWNLTIEQQWFRDWVFSVGYRGSHGSHLLGVINSNRRISEVLPDGRLFFPAGNPFTHPQFGRSRLTGNFADSIYHALVVSVNKRYSAERWGALNFQLSYTASKSIDNSSQTNPSSIELRNSENLIMNPDDLGQDRSLSGFDVRQNFVTNFTYELPLGRNWSGIGRRLADGWQLTGIVSASSGRPFTITNSFNRSRDGTPGNPGERPDLRPGANNNPVLGGPDRYFDATAFALQPAGFYGNLGRNSVVSPGLANLDFSLIKTTTVRENLNVQFRVEFFNLLNRANFGLPQRTVFRNANGAPAADAGRISETITASRQIQFGAKILF